MSFPKSVIIGGRPWPVISDKSVDGGSWTTNPGEIRIGPHKSEEERMIWLFHEIFEAILAMGHHRFECYPNKDNDLFVFNHKELTQIVRELYGAIKPILPMMGKK